MDRIAELGGMALGSRLRRLVRRLDNDVSRIYQENGIDFKPRWFPIVHLLAKLAPLSVTDISKELNFSHTAIRKFADEMIKKGLLTESRDKNDERRCIFQLTPKGRRTVDSLTSLWENIHKTADRMLKESKPNLLEALSAIEANLDSKEFFERYNELTNQSLYDKKSK